MEVLYEDNHIIAVNKTCNEIVQGDKTGDTPLSETVKAYIKEKYNKPGEVFLGVTHRLDRPTSGVVLFARTSKALTRLNEMFLCTEQEVSDFRKVNDRLYELTQKMHEKALSLYRAILKEGYDRDFDDDIMVEGTVKYVFNDAWGSVILTGEERRNMYEKPLEPYWSDFPAMLEILYEYYENTLEPECASCFASYELFHKPDMDPKEFGLENFLDDGQSWAEGLFDREEFKDICICHAVHEMCQHKMYSIPDLLRMNDFWCEVKVTHQLLSDRDGKRFSYIERK